MRGWESRLRLRGESGAVGKADDELSGWAEEDAGAEDGTAAGAKAAEQSSAVILSADQYF